MKSLPDPNPHKSLCNFDNVDLRFEPVVGSSTKVIMQGKLFQRRWHLLYCSVLSLGANVNTRLMPQPETGSIFHIKNQRNILVKGKND